MGSNDETLLALDIGEKRVGLAIADSGVSIARPLTTLQNSASIFADIKRVVFDNNVTTIVAGYPRGLDGQHTAQTDFAEKFIDSLRQATNLPIVLQDEALTSVKAEDELSRRGRPYRKEDVDSLAATYILEDYINDNIKELHV